MKKATKIGAVAALALVAGSAFAGIANSKHNLAAGAGSVAGNNQFDPTDANATSEICAFCHTPHGGATGASVPLWNKGLTTATYTTYNSSTLDQTSAPGMSGSPSLACLSCHDGTQAMNNFINQPGSGGWTPDTGAVQAGTWTAAAAAGRSPVITAGADAGKFAAPASGNGIANLTTDLSNDHPIGVWYCGATAANSTTGALTCGDADFNSAVGSSDKQLGFRASPATWWVNTGTGTGTNREKTDLVLYTRTNGGVTAPSVECGTCHDPHSTTNNTFLRISNQGSAVCLTCHNK